MKFIFHSLQKRYFLKEYRFKNEGFTLIELLTVIALIGLISSIVLVSVKDSRKKAEEKKSMQFSASIQHSLGAYPIGTWSFEDSLNDSSGNGNNGQWVDGAGSYAKGIINRAVQFTGTNYIFVPSSKGLNSRSRVITIEFWAYLNEFNDSILFFYQDNNFPLSSLGYMSCGYSLTGDLLCDIHGHDISGTSYITVSSALKTQEWFHVVLTYDGHQTTKLFFNTKEYILQGGFDLTDRGIIDGEAELSIGGEGITGIIADKVNGLMDEMRIYDSYITISEVKKHYAEGLFKIGLRELAKK